MKYTLKKIALFAIGAAMTTWSVNATAGNPDARKQAKPVPPTAAPMGSGDTRKASATTPTTEAASMGSGDTRKATAPATPEEPAAMGNADQRTPAPKQ